MEKTERSCIDCGVKNCSKMDKTYPDFCLTTHMDPEVLEEAMACYQEEEVRQVTIAAAEVEYEHYCQYTRIEEIMEFARKIGAKKLGDRHLCRAFAGKPYPGGNSAAAWV